jgi:small subunit ribosomal protein S2
MSDLNTTTTEEPLENKEEKRVERISVHSMLKSGAQFGHPTSDWHPKMARYLYGARNGVYIFNLDVTLKLWKRARQVIVDIVANGGSILMVGAKKQCKEILKEEAQKCGAFYVDHKWVAGTLTNFDTVRISVDKIDKFENLINDPNIKLTKKEKLLKSKEREKLLTQFGGIKDMTKLPSALFVVDIVKHRLAIEEARNLNIPVIALVDSNVDPDCIDYIIPVNDDATGSLKLFISNVADAVTEGKVIQESKREEKALQVDEKLRDENRPKVEKKGRRVVIEPVEGVSVNFEEKK